MGCCGSKPAPALDKMAKNGTLDSAQLDTKGGSGFGAPAGGSMTNNSNSYPMNSMSPSSPIDRP